MHMTMTFAMAMYERQLFYILTEKVQQYGARGITAVGLLFRIFVKTSIGNPNFIERFFYTRYSTSPLIQ